ncbi:arginine---tRNA ligase [Spizellomyces sp. 'palustris']|nr:arginine---tRNA ligase [Spizellomyces sp. 'palustris']
MGELFQLHIATELAPIVSLPPTSFLPFIERNRRPFKEPGQFTLPVAKLIALYRQHPETKCSHSELTPAALAASIASRWVPTSHVRAVTATSDYLSFHVDSRLFISSILDAVRSGELSRPEKSRNHSAIVHREEEVVVEFEFPNIGQVFSSRYWRSLAVAAFVERCCKLRSQKGKLRCKIGIWNKHTEILLLACQRNGFEEGPCTPLLLHRNFERTLEEITTNPTLVLRSKKLLYDLYCGIPAIVEMWSRAWEAWRESFTPVLERMGISGQLETDELVSKKRADRFLTFLQEAGLLKPGRNAGEQIVDLRDWQLGTALLMTGDGVPTQVLVDAVILMDRGEGHITRTYVVAEMGRQYPFQQSRKLVELVESGIHDFIDVPFGKIYDMDIRASEPVLSPEPYLNCAKVYMEDIMREKGEHVENELVTQSTAPDMIGLTALLFQTYQPRRTKNFVYNWSRIVSNESDIGVYIQYTHARLASVLCHAPSPNPEVDITPLLSTPIPPALVSKLSRYPHVLFTTLNTHDPSVLVTYLVELSREVGSCLSGIRVKGQSSEVKEARAELIRAIQTVLSWGLSLLGVKGVDRM